MNTLQTALVKYKPNYCPSSNTYVPEKAVPTKELEMGTKKLTLKEKDAILTQYNNGLNGVEIAEVTGLKYNQVNYYLSKVKKRRGGASREVVVLQKAIEKQAAGPRTWTRVRISPETIQKLKDTAAAHSDWSFRQIGDHCGVSQNTAKRYITGKRLQYKEGTSKRGPRGPYRKAIKATEEKHALPTPVKAADFTDIDRAIMMAEMKLEILKELKGRK